MCVCVSFSLSLCLSLSPFNVRYTRECPFVPACAPPLPALRRPCAKRPEAVTLSNYRQLLNFKGILPVSIGLPFPTKNSDSVSSRFALLMAVTGDGAAVDHETVVVSALRQAVPDLRKLLEFYAPPMDEFSKQLDASTVAVDGKSLKLDDKLRQFVRKLSSVLDLNELDSLRLLRRSFPSAFGEDSVPGDAFYTETTVQYLLDIQTEERTATLKLVLWILQTSSETKTASPWFAVAKELTTQLIGDRPEEWVKTICEQCKSALSHKRSLRAKNSSLVEQTALLDVLLASLTHFPTTAKKTVQLVRIVVDCSGLIATKASSSIPPENIGIHKENRLKCATVVLGLLRMESILVAKTGRLTPDDMHLSNSPSSIQLLDHLFQDLSPDDPFAGLICFAWSGYMSKLYDIMADKLPHDSYRPVLELVVNGMEGVELFKVYALRAMQSNAFAETSALLKSGLSGDASAAQIAKSNVVKAISLFASTFELEYTTADAEIIQTAIYALHQNEDVVAEMWKYPGRNSLKHLVEYSLQTFPVRFQLFAGLVNSIAQVRECAVSLFAVLDRIEFFTQDATEISPDHASHIGNKAIEVVQMFNILSSKYAESPKFNIPVGSQGAYLVRPNGR